MQAYREVENEQLAFVILDSTSLLLKMLIFFGQLYKIPPQNLIELSWRLLSKNHSSRVHLIFYASYCRQIIIYNILGHSDRPSESDSLNVLARGGQLL